MERTKNDLKKSCGNLFRNQTENNNKILKTKCDRDDSSKNQKNISIGGNSRKPKIIKRINTEQKMSLINKLYKIEFGKIINKKIIKSPTVVSIMNNNKNKERSHSHGINRRSIKSVNKIALKNKTNRIYYNLFSNNNVRKIKILPSTPYTITKKSIEKSTKRNLTTIPYNNESNKVHKSIKKNKKKNRLLNEVFNTVNFNNMLENNLSYNSLNNKHNYYFNIGNYYSELDRKTIKTKKVIFNNKHSKKSKTNFTIKKKRYIYDGFNDNMSNSNKNIFINNSYSNTNNNKKYQKLYSFKNFPVLKSKRVKNENKNKSTDNKNNINTNTSKKHYSKKINQNHKKKSPRINDMYNPLSLLQKSLASSIGVSQSNSNIDIIRKRNSYTYNLNKKMKKNNKIKNICIKKLNIPPFCNINKYNNNFIQYKKYFKSNKDILTSEPIIFSNREETNSKLNNMKNNLNVSVNENYISCNHNTFLHNVKPIYLNLKNNINIQRKKLNNINKNINRNKRINTANSGCSIKNNKLINSQIFNNYYSINNIDASNLPVKVINFYN